MESPPGRGDGMGFVTGANGSTHPAFQAPLPGGERSRYELANLIDYLAR